MNFLAFQAWRSDCLRGDPTFLDCGETNVYQALATFQPQLSTSPNHKVHRCDLAGLWLARYGLSDYSTRRALVSRGVRHALHLIFDDLVRQQAVLWLPSDVYPVYWDIARASGINPRSFDTLPQPILPRDTPNTSHPEYLLLANPWKPLGRFVSEDEVATLGEWLAASTNRQLLVDCVYDLSAPFHTSTSKLQATGRATLLHSVAKGWLWPKTFGITLIQNINAAWEHAFRDESPTNEQLQLAESLFSQQSDVPRRVLQELDARRRQLMATLPADVVASLIDAKNLAAGSYLLPSHLTTEELLRQHRIIGIPGSAFGANWKGSILSCLGKSCTTAS